MRYFFIKQNFKKKKVSLLDAACGLLLTATVTSSPVMAAPQGGEIFAGQGSISNPSLTTTQVQQLSNNLVIDWQSFNVDANELVQFLQPSANSAVLNRINDIAPSEIFGSINANGLVFLMNPNGIVFGAGANIQVGGLFATNLETDPNRFMSGDYAFESVGMIDGMIVNHGVISAATGGVSLVSDTGVVNDGKILANVGSINLAVAKSATLDFTGDGLLQLSVSGEVLDNAQSLDAAISNSGEIIAEGGDVLISGQVARDVFTNVVNNSGIIKATRVIDEGGVITLAGPSGNIDNSGTLDVSGAEAGEIVVTAENISHSGLIDASATEGNGGSVSLQSSNDTFLQDQSLITVQADNGNGGTVHVLGNRVGLFDESSVDASGSTGGGEVLIGGDYQGKNADVQNASQTYVGKNTSIIADAIEAGDGGKVIVWADETTQFYGNISAQGGVVSGDGGFIEVSGKWFDITGSYVDTTAVNGNVGTLLLDPTDITILDGTGDGDDADADNASFVGDPSATAGTVTQTDTTPTQVYESELEGIAATTNIELQATNNITINSLTDGVLNLAQTGGNSVTFTADADGDNSGDFSMDAADTIQTAGGSLTISGASVSTGNIVTNGGDLLVTSSTDSSINNSIATAGGSVVFQAGQHITFGDTNDSIQTSGGNIHLEADSEHSAAGAADGTGALTLGSLDSGGGDITLLAAGGGFGINNTISAGVGDVYISTSDNTAIDLDADITQAGFDNIASTGGLFVGQATTAGTDGAGTGSVVEYAASTSMSASIAIASASASSFNLISTDGFSGSGGSVTLTANQALIINGDVDSNNVGKVDIEGQVEAGSHDISITAYEIEGDNDSSSPPNEITTTGTLTLTANIIGITQRPLNIGSVSNLIINDLGTGDIEINLTGGNAIDIGVSSNAIDLSNLNSITDFTYNNTHSSVSLGTLSAAGKNLTINATNGITDNTSVITAQNLTLTASGLDAAIGASGAANDINTTLSGSLTATANNGTGGIYISQAGALDIASIHTDTGNFELATTGAITQSGAIAVGGTASIDAGANAITLTNAGNDFVGAVSVSNSAANAVQVTDVNAIDLGTVNVGDGGFSINATGAITQSGILTVAGASSFNAGANAITLTNAGNDFGGAVSLSNTGAFDVEVTDASAIDLGTVNVGTGAFNVTAVTGDITDSGVQTVDGIATFTVADAGNIILDSANTYNAAVNFAASAGTLGNVTFVDSTAYDVQAGGLIVGGNLDITAAGITQTGGALSVTGTSSFNVGANVITLTDAANDFTGAVSLINSASNAVQVTDVNAIDLGTSSVGDGGFTIIAGGAITQSGALTVAGVSSFNAGANAITLTDAANDFVGAVSLSNSGLNDVTVTDANAIQLGTVAVGTGAFSINAGGAITQTSALSIAGTSSFSAGANAITLDNATNNFSGAVSLSNSTATATIVDTNAIDLGTVTVGNLDVTAVGITQSGIITATGTASFDAGAGAITLTDAGNDFAGAVNLANSVANAVQVSDTNAIDLGSVNVAGTLIINAGTDITDSGTQTVTGAASFNVGNGGNITLDDAANAYASTVAFNSAGTLNNVTFVDTTALDLQASTIGGNLNVTGAGISQSGILNVTGTSSFNAGGNTIALNLANDFTGAVSLSNSGANAVSITDVNAIDLGTVDVGGTFTVNAGTDITDSGTQIVTGAADFNVGNGGNITLDDAANAYASTVSFNSAGTLNNVTFVDTTALDLQASTIGGNLNVTGAGISQSGILNVTGTSSFNAGANTIALNLANDFTGAVSLSNSGANAVSVTDASAIQLGTVNVGTGSFSVNATGAITQTSALSIAGTSSFNAGANAITLTDAANDFVGAVSLSNSGLNDVAVSDTNAIQLGTVAVGTGTFTINAGGAITQTSALSIAGASSFSAGANAITLDNAANDFSGAVSLSNSAATATIVDTNAIDLGTVTVGNLDVAAVGITQSGIITTTGTASFDAGAGAITLTDAGNDFAGAVNLANSVANAVQVSDTNAIDLGSVNVAGTLIINAGTDITDSGTQTVTGTASFNVGNGGNITLDDASNAYASTVAFNSAGTLNNVTFVDTTALDLQASTIGGNLNVTGAGISQSGILNITGTSSFNAGANTIALNLANDFTGAVSLSNSGANAVSVADASAIQLGTVNVGTGSFSVNAGGAITQTSALSIAGTSSFNAGANAITLTDAANDFVGAVSLSNSGLNDVAVSDTNAIQLGTVAVGTGAFTINAGGAITQTSALSIAGTSSFSAGANAITLNAANDFIGAVSLSNSGFNNVAITDVNTIDLGVVNVGTGTFTVTAANITDSGIQTVDGEAIFNVGDAGNITLNSANAYNAGVTFASTGVLNNVTFVDTTAYDVQTAGLTVGGALHVQAAGITQTGELTIANASSFNATGANSITLANTANDFTGTVSLFSSGDSATIVDTNAIDLGTVIVGNLDVTAVGITQSGIITATGTASFDAGAGAITLTDAGNDFAGAVNLANSVANAVQVSDATAIDLGSVNVAGTLIINAGTDITDSGTQIVTGAADFNVGNGGNITLDDAANAYASTVSFNSAGTLNNVTFVDTTALDLQASTIGGNLNVTGAGISQSGILNVTGTSSFNAGANSIALNLANDFTGAVSLGNSGANAVSVTDANAIQLGTVNVGSGSFTVNAAGAITQTSALSIAGTSSFNAGANAITLTDVANDFVGAVSLSNSGLNDVAVTDANAIQLGTVAVGTGAFTINAGGAITQTSALNIAGLTTLAAGAANNIVLDNAGNNFSNIAIASANDVTLYDASGGVAIAASTVSGDYTLTSVGSITSSGLLSAANANLTVTGLGNSIGSAVTPVATDLSGSLTATAGNGSGSIYISDAGNLEIASINAGTGNVVLRAVGSIVDAAGTDTAIDIVANNLTIDSTAGAGVSAADALNLQVSGLTITNSTGDFFLTEANALTLRDVTVGSIDLFAGGALTVRGNLTTTTGDLKLVSAGVLSILWDESFVIGGTTNITLSDPALASSLCSTQGGCSLGLGDQILTTDRTYDPITLNSSVGGNIVLTSDDIQINVNAANDYNYYQLIPWDWYFYKNTYSDATLNAGANSVIFDTYTASNALTLGTMLTAAEIGRISAASSVQFGTLANTGGVQLTSNINTATFSDTLLVTSGAVSSTAAANTLTVDNLSIDADKGIGSAATALRVSSNTISAVNRSSGDIYLSFVGNTTLGGVGQTIENQAADSTIGIAATGNLIIGNDFTVSGNGTVSLDANGTITRTAGTITANTVNLGSNGTTTSIGASGTPVLVSSANINAETKTGDIYLQNDQAVNLTMSAAGNAEFVNTSGAISSVAAQAINAANNLLLDADSLNFVAGSSVAAGGNLMLRADNMEFAATSIVSGANINLYTQTTTAGFLLGDNTDAVDQVELATTELQALSSSGTVTIGENGVNTGDIILGGPVDLSSESFSLSLETEGKIDTLSAGNTLSLLVDPTFFGAGKMLTLDALSIGETNPIETSVDVLNIVTNDGVVNIINSVAIDDLQINAGAGVVDISTAGYMVASTNLIAAAFTLDARNFFYLTGAGAIDSSAGDIAITVESVESAVLTESYNLIILEDSAAITASAGDLFLTADRMIFDENSISTLTGNNITLSPYTTNRDTVLGSLAVAGDDIGIEPTTLNLNSAELAMLNSTGTVTIGGVGYSGNVNMGQTAVDLSAENFDFTVTTTGSIDDTTGLGNALSLNAGKLLSLEAGAGIGDTHAIAFTADSVSAVNTDVGAVGDQSLALAPTGNITLGGVGITIDQQSVDGLLSIKSGGDIVIAADVAVSGGGLSTVSLGASGTITRTGGTVIANTINLGSATTTSIGASGTPVLLDGSIYNINSSGDVYAEGVGTTAAQLSGTTANITFVQSGAGDLALGALVASGSVDASTTSSNIIGVSGEAVQADTIAVTSWGSIGVGSNNTLFVDATTSLSLTTNGAGVAGSIFASSNSTIPLLGLTTNNGDSATIIGLGASSFDITSAIGDGSGNLSLTADETINPLDPNAGSILIKNNLNYINLYLFASDTISQTAGAITVTNDFLIRADNEVSLPGANNDVGGVIAASVVNAGQGFVFNDVNDLAVGTVTYPADSLLDTSGITTNAGSINLTTGGILTQSAAGVISGGLLTTNTVGGAILNTATNNITAYNGTDTNGDILLADSGTLNITGISTTGNVTLKADSLSQSGVISSDQLTTDTVNGSLLSGTNTVNGYAAINTISGNVQFNNDIATLTLAGINQTGSGNVIISNTGNIVASDAIISNAINLTAGGAITQNATGTLTGGVLTTSSAGGTTLGLNNALSGFNGTDSASGNILLVDTGALNITGISTGGDINLTADSLTQTGIISANQLTTNTVNGSVLNSTNTLNSYAATNITSGNIELNNDAPTLTLAGITQSGGGDVIITNTGAIITGGATTVNDSGTLNLNSGTDLTISHAVTANAINLAAAGSISQNGSGTFTGGVLTSQSNGGATFNLVNAITGFNASDIGGGDILVVDSGALDIIGVSTTGNISLSAGSLTDSGVISGNELTTNTVNGSVLDNAHTVNSYTASNSGSGNVVLNDNKATLTLAGITQSGGGDVIISNTGAIVTSGTTTVNGGGLNLNSGANLTISHAVAANAITLSTGGVLTQDSSGTLSGGLLTSNSVGGTTLALNNAITGFNATDTSGNILLVDGGTLDIAGISTTGNVTLTADSLSQSGAISVNQLTTTTANGSVLNSLNTVNSYTAGNTSSGNIELSNNTATLTLAGINQSGSGDVIITNTGNIVGDAITSNAINLSAGGTIAQTAAFTGTLLTTSSNGGTTLGLNNAIDSFNGTDINGAILLVDNGALDITGINTAGNINLTTGSLTQSGAIAGNLLTTTTAGGSTLSNTGNAVAAYIGSDSAGGSIALANTGALDVGAITTAADISVSSTGNVSQSDNIASTGGGNISVTSTSGSITMVNGLNTTTASGNITYQASGNIAVSLLDAASGTPADVGIVSVTSDVGNIYSTDFFNASVRANTVNLTAGNNIGQDELNAFVLSSDIQGKVTLNYSNNAYITTAPNINVTLDIDDFGSGVINSGAARSAGTQRSQSSGLEDVGFIDLALFSDINLFVIDGIGIALPADQSDEPPLPANIPVNDDDKKKKKPSGLHVSGLLH